MLSFTIKHPKYAVYFGISKLILHFPYRFYVPGALFFTAYFHTGLSCFAVFVIERTQKKNKKKRCYPNDSTLLSLRIVHRSVSQTYKF